MACHIILSIFYSEYQHHHSIWYWEKVYLNISNLTLLFQQKLFNKLKNCKSQLYILFLWKQPEKKIENSRRIFQWIFVKKHEDPPYNSDENILEMLLSWKRWDRPRSSSHFLSLFYTWLVKNNSEILSFHRKTINSGHYSMIVL